MTDYLKYLSSLKSVKEIINKIKEENRIEISEANKDISSLLSLFLKDNLDENTVIVAPNIYQAQSIFDHLKDLDDEVYFYPKDDFISTELLTESLEFSLERVHTLKNIFNTKKKYIVVTNLTSILNKVPRKEKYLNGIINLKLNQMIKPKDLLDKLIKIGYKRCYTVERQGEFSLRGSVFDIFPINENHAIRLDFFGDEIDALKIIDIESQRSVGNIDNISIMPKGENFFTEDEVETIKFFINDKLNDKTLSKETREKFTKDLETISIDPNNPLLSKYLFLFIKEDYSFIDYIDNKRVLFFDYKDIRNKEAQLFDEIYGYLANFNGYLKPFSFLNSLDSYIPKLDKYVFFESGNNPTIKYDLKSIDVPYYTGNYNMFIFDLNNEYKNKTVLLSADSKSFDIVTDILDSNNIKYYKSNPIKEGKINIRESNFFSFELLSENLVIIDSERILKARKTFKAKYRLNEEGRRLKSIKELKKGDFVVHYDYGVGEFVEIKTMSLGTKTSDYIHIKYSDDESVYVPVESISSLYKYSAEDGYKPKLSKLNTKEWKKTRESAREKAKLLADKLLNVYSTRQDAEGFKYKANDEIEEEFASDFGYNLTRDQEKAIEEVKKDMEEGVLMDRLICGDVGFGKTEVAMRAALKAVISGRQVAVVAPTTILARQHYQNFKSRMEKFGIEIGLLSRFVSPKEIKKTIKNTEEGKVDIVIGTHRVLSNDVKFKDIGLLIIDEEQKFGVEAKEKIKEMKVNIDVLTLTATPIPRTLQMAVTGLKNISLIETAPINRYPVQTYVLERNDYIVKDAIERELSKGGQVFYLYNRVEDIDKIYLYLKSLVPDARYATIHGKLSRVDIENIIDLFMNKEIDVLISTTIIENGIDIPNVNTLIIHDSDRYGLSQLYQIKGRVGRGERIGYAYLMYDKRKTLTPDAEKRLQAIKDFAELGSGFKIAVRDLTVRGAGEILGKEQSGFINKVGVELYLKILDDEIKKRKNEYVEEEKDEYKLFISRHVDESYIKDDYSKIEVHTKISKLESLNELNDLVQELTDRFGKVEDNLLTYMYAKLTENLINKCNFEREDVTDNRALFVLSPEKTNIADSETLFKTAYQISRNFTFYYKLRRMYIEYKYNESSLSMYRDLSLYLEKCLSDLLF